MSPFTCTSGKYADDAQTNPKILYPASQSNVITVGALDKDHKPAEWSNFGTRKWFSRHNKRPYTSHAPIVPTHSS